MKVPPELASGRFSAHSEGPTPCSRGLLLRACAPVFVAALKVVASLHVPSSRDTLNRHVNRFIGVHWKSTNWSPFSARVSCFQPFICVPMLELEIFLYLQEGLFVAIARVAFVSCPELVPS